MQILCVNYLLLLTMLVKIQQSLFIQVSSFIGQMHIFLDLD